MFALAQMPNKITNFISFSLICSDLSLLELADTVLSRNYNKHNNRLILALKLSCTSRTRKNTGKHLSVLFPLSYVHSWGKLLLIVVL
jgi:hypothetical protein